MKTFLQLINQIMIMLREDQVAANDSTDYSTLIGTFINKAKHIVEDAWTWHRLRTTIRVQTTSGTFSYSLTGAGDRYKILTRSGGWDPDDPDVLNDTQDTWLQAAPSSSWMTLMLNSNNPQTTIPEWFDINGYDVNYDPIVNFYPIPNSSDYINFQMYIPQADLTADADVLIIPWRPVVELAYLFSLEERGEDAGTISDRIEQWERTILADAISTDSGKAKNELVWEPV